MAYQLLTSWQAHRAALSDILTHAQREILIYDGDLSRLPLDSPATIQELRRFLVQQRELGQRQVCLRLALRHAAPLVATHPRLATLLDQFGHLFELRETPPSLGHLRDAMVVADGHMGLIRFYDDQPRGKHVHEEAQECSPYRQRFNALWMESIPYSITPTGL